MKFTEPTPWTIITVITVDGTFTEIDTDENPWW